MHMALYVDQAADPCVENHYLPDGNQLGIQLLYVLLTSLAAGWLVRMSDRTSAAIHATH